MGDLVYRLKYLCDKSALKDIVDSLMGFLTGRWKLAADIVVPVPPSNTRRRIQPVHEVAAALSERCGIPLCASCIKKVKSTAELKNVYGLGARTAVLKEAFAVNRSMTAGQRILLLDDLYRSGATAGAISRTLLKDGEAKAVHLLCLTRTRRSP
jgi:predicted amidophosphoribosyltransferase